MGTPCSECSHSKCLPRWRREEIELSLAGLGVGCDDRIRPSSRTWIEETDALRYFYLAIVLAIVFDSLFRCLIARFASERAQRQERDIESAQRQERDIEEKRDPANVEQQQLGLNEEGLYRQWLKPTPRDKRTALEKSGSAARIFPPKLSRSWSRTCPPSVAVWSTSSRLQNAICQRVIPYSFGIRFRKLDG